MLAGESYIADDPEDHRGESADDDPPRGDQPVTRPRTRRCGGSCSPTFWGPTARERRSGPRSIATTDGRRTSAPGRSRTSGSGSSTSTRPDRRPRADRSARPGAHAHALRSRRNPGGTSGRAPGRSPSATTCGSGGGVTRLPGASFCSPERFDPACSDRKALGGRAAQDQVGGFLGDHHADGIRVAGRDRRHH